MLTMDVAGAVKDRLLVALLWSLIKDTLTFVKLLAYVYQCMLAFLAVCIILMMSART